MATLQEDLFKAILQDEMEYCFDREYCSDEEWAETSPNMSRQEAFVEVMNEYKNASVEQIIIDFGDKYEEILDIHNYPK